MEDGTAEVGMGPTCWTRIWDYEVVYGGVGSVTTLGIYFVKAGLKPSVQICYISNFRVSNLFFMSS